MHRRRALVTLFTWPLMACQDASVSPTTGPTPGPQPDCYVDPDFQYGLISPFVRASNTGPWQTLAREHLDASAAVQLAMIRWPGGNWGDENDVTPQMVDEYIAMCRVVGAEPCIHVRLFGGSPDQAAALVRYTNVTQGYAVKYWAIGNEPDLFVKKRGAERYTVADYAADFVAYRAAMKAVDASIVVMGPEISQFDADEGYPVDSTGEPWLRGFLKRVSDLEMLSWHKYPFGATPVTNAQLQADPPQWQASIAKSRALMREYLGREIPLAITEANSDWSGRVDADTGTNSYANALWWSDVLGRIIAADCIIVAHFCMGAIPSQGIGMFGPVSYNSGPLPIYQSYVLLQKLGPIRIHASSAHPDLFLLATRDHDGTVAVHAVNQSTTDITMPLVIAGNTAPQAQVWRYRIDQDVRDEGKIDVRAPVTWPAQSATVLHFASKT